MMTLRLALVCGAISTAAGCAAIPVATLAAAGSAVQSGTSVWKSGRLTSAQAAGIDAAVPAVDRTVEELRFRVRARLTRPTSTTWYLTDDHGMRVRVSVYHRTDAFSSITVDMGVFGSQAIARLIMERIEAHLTEADVPIVPTADGSG